MNAEIEALYNALGLAACDFAADLNGRLLVYAEISSDLRSADLFYEKGPTRAVTFRFCPQSLQDLLYSLWEKSRSAPGGAEWSGIAYFVEDGNFKIDLTYPDQMDPDEDLAERRPRVIEKYFGKVEVDYSRP